MVRENLQKIRSLIDEACKQAGRDPSEVLLVAVSKTKPVSAIREAKSTGQVHFGENRVQELVKKMEQVDGDIQWHMIGTLQTNKIKYMINRIDWIESVHKIKALAEIEKRAAPIQRVIQALIQVNISGEKQKSGCEPEELRDILRYAQNLNWVKIRGLMGIAELTENPEDVRPQFRLLRTLRDLHRDTENENMRLEHLSMGMTHDFRVAIEEGSTMVRIGTAIFGEREYT